MNSVNGNGLIIFGGTGDLTKRKLIPAIYNLLEESMLPDGFFAVLVGRREKSRDEIVNDIENSIKKYSRKALKEDLIELLKSRIYYYKMDFSSKKEYGGLSAFVNELEKEYKINGNRLFYLAVSPEFFGIISKNLKSSKMANRVNGYKRVVIEKPFGKDLESAKKLNNQIVKVFDEENTYRVDHYLGKEMLQNIMVIRFANSLFEQVWNSQYIDNVQITSSETLGVSERGGYYDKTGALKDMVQNHLLQFMALIAMEQPASLDTEDIRDEKVKVLKSIKKYSPQQVNDNAVRGQYSNSEDDKYVSYRDEMRTNDDSDTETYAAVKVEIDNKRWNGVPFYIRTGKRLDKKCTQVVITFKVPKSSLYKDAVDNSIPNQLIIRIQPTEGVYVSFNAKQPGIATNVIPVSMDFCQSCQIGYNSLEAYERLLLDVMNGDKTLFTRWDEVASSWEFIDSIYKVWKKEKPDFPNYTAGTNGPDLADDLLKKDGRKWYNN